jgi:hypothetical protein
MGKKNKGKKPKAWEYALGTGKAGKLMDRYDVEGVHYGHPDGRSGKPNRSIEDVEKDIAKKMMNDYDTRRSMEAAAMLGDKDAKKFAKKGFKGGNIYGAWDTMKALKKEHVGGGGMNGPENRAGLTHALVKADRKAFNEDIDSRISEATAKGSSDGQAAIPEYQIDNPVGQRGGRENNTSAVYDDYQDAYKLAGIGTDVFSTGGEGQAATEESIGSGPIGAAEQLKEFQNKVKTGMALAGVQTRGSQSGVIPGDGF